MKSKFPFAILIGVATMFLIACSQAAAKTETVDMAKLKTEIQAMEDAYSAAEKKKDAEGIVAYYSDDAISYGRNAEPYVGKAAIKKSLEDRMAKDTTGNVSSYKIVDLFAEGDMAVEIGSWTTINPAGAETEKGFYTSYFQKRDGKYLCVRDMSVTTAPVKKP